MLVLFLFTPPTFIIIFIIYIEMLDVSMKITFLLNKKVHLMLPLMYKHSE